MCLGQAAVEWLKISNLTSGTNIYYGAQPSVVWIFGLSGAGKTTLGRSLVEWLRARKCPVVYLDGDEFRKGVSRDLGFSERCRAENIRRGAEVARLCIDSGITTVAAFITPLKENRDTVRLTIGSDRVLMVFADSPLEICRSRDPKGLYRKVVQEKILNFTGVDAPFERPGNDADLEIDTGSSTLTHSSRTLTDAFVDRFGFPLERSQTLTTL